MYYNAPVRLLCALLLLPTLACGPERSGPPLLWSIQAQGGGAPSYLLGTMHIGVSARDDLPSSVWDAFDGATRLVEEAEIRFIDQQEYLKLASLTDGQLDGLLPEDVWLALVALLPDVSLTRLRALRPWAVSSLVFNKLVPGVEGMDLTFLGATVSTGKARAFLELWQDQVNALNQIPLEDDLAALVELVRERETYKDRLEGLIERYLEGDADGVYRDAPAAGAIPEPGTALFDTFIRDRTQRWLPALEAELQSGGVFVAVGFGHVLGPEGLVQLLGKRGYTVTRVE